METLQVLKELSRDLKKCSLMDCMEQLKKAGWTIDNHCYDISINTDVISGYFRAHKDSCSFQFCFTDNGNLSRIYE